MMKFNEISLLFYSRLKRKLKLEYLRSNLRAITLFIFSVSFLTLSIFLMEPQNSTKLQEENSANISINGTEQIYSEQYIQASMNVDGNDDSKADIKKFEYKVQKGDTLSSIARDFDISVEYLLSFNSIDNRHLIYPGEILEIPDYKGKSKVTMSSKKSPDIATNYLDYDLRSSSNLDASQINYFLMDTKLEGLGDAFIEAEMQYGINAKYLMALAIHESNWGKSQIATDKYNLFGFRAYDANAYSNAMTYSSFEESIDYAASFISKNYLNEDGKYYNGPTLVGINIRYASSDTWATEIAAIMQKFDKKVL